MARYFILWLFLQHTYWDAIICRIYPTYGTWDYCIIIGPMEEICYMISTYIILLLCHCHILWWFKELRIEEIMSELCARDIKTERSTNWLVMQPMMCIMDQHVCPWVSEHMDIKGPMQYIKVIKGNIQHHSKWASPKIPVWKNLT